MRNRKTIFANLVGSQWAIEPRWAEAMLSQLRAQGTLAGLPARAFEEDGAPPQQASVRRDSGGVAVVSIIGPMSKEDVPCVDGANTVRIREAIRSAAADQSIASIVVRVDSPGGTVDGTMELADEVRAANAVKPVIGFAEDLAASAAYWAISQARKVYANANAVIGSIGAYAAIIDSSKAYELAGFKMILISSGGLKGAGMEGTEVTPEMVAYWQGLIDARGKFFLDAVGAGRGLSKAEVKALADGRVHVAADAKRLGLIDAIKTFDEVMVEAAAVKPRRGRMQAALIDIEAASD